MASPPAATVGQFSNCELLAADSFKILRPAVGEQFLLKSGSNGAEISLVDPDGQVLATVPILQALFQRKDQELEDADQELEKVVRINLPDLTLRLEAATGPNSPQDIEICRSHR